MSNTLSVKNIKLANYMGPGEFLSALKGTYKVYYSAQTQSIAVQRFSYKEKLSGTRPGCECSDCMQLRVDYYWATDPNRRYTGKWEGVPAGYTYQLLPMSAQLLAGAMAGYREPASMLVELLSLRGFKNNERKRAFTKACQQYLSSALQSDKQGLKYLSYIMTYFRHKTTAKRTEFVDALMSYLRRNDGAFSDCFAGWVMQALDLYCNKRQPLPSGLAEKLLRDATLRQYRYYTLAIFLLERALEIGDSLSAEILLTADFDKKFRDRYSIGIVHDSMLSNAIYQRHKAEHHRLTDQTIKMLVIHKSSRLRVIKDRSGRTPLINAVMYQDAFVYQHLLLFDNVRRKIDHADKNGKTALMNAVNAGDDVAAQCLLESGANPFKRDKKKRNAFHSVSSDHHEMFDKMLAHKGAKNAINKRDKNGCSALLRAVADNDQDKVIALLTSGANPFALNNQGETVLHLAACLPDENSNAAAGSDGAQRMSMMATLLESIANTDKLINQKDKQGNTPLLRALLQGHVNMAIALAAAGAQIDAVNVEGTDVESLASGYPGLFERLAQIYVDGVRRRDCGESKQDLPCDNKATSLIDSGLALGKKVAQSILQQIKTDSGFSGQCLVLRRRLLDLAFCVSRMSDSDEIKALVVGARLQQVSKAVQGGAAEVQKPLLRSRTVYQIEKLLGQSLGLVLTGVSSVRQSFRHTRQSVFSGVSAFFGASSNAAAASGVDNEAKADNEVLHDEASSSDEEPVMVYHDEVANLS